MATLPKSPYYIKGIEKYLGIVRFDLLVAYQRGDEDNDSNDRILGISAVKTNVIPYRMELVEPDRILNNCEPEEFKRTFPFLYAYVDKREFYDILAEGLKSNYETRMTILWASRREKDDTVLRQRISNPDLELVLSTEALYQGNHKIYCDPASTTVMMNAVGPESIDAALTKVMLLENVSPNNDEHERRIEVFNRRDKDVIINYQIPGDRKLKDFLRTGEIADTSVVQALSKYRPNELNRRTKHLTVLLCECCKIAGLETPILAGMEICLLCGAAGMRMDIPEGRLVSRIVGKQWKDLSLIHI